MTEQALNFTASNCGRREWLQNFKSAQDDYLLAVFSDSFRRGRKRLPWVVLTQVKSLCFHFINNKHWASGEQLTFQEHSSKAGTPL